jgi:hypothetical protein
MGKRRRSIVAVVMALTLLLALATAAAAYVYKDGTKTCGANYTPYSRSYSTGFTEHFPPGSGYYSWNNGSTWIVRKRYANQPGGGGWWEVKVTSGSLNDPGTYAGCDLTGG